MVLNYYYSIIQANILANYHIYYDYNYYLCNKIGKYI